MLSELAVLLEKQNINFNSIDRCIMCFPHVINICCQHVISTFTNAELSESTEEFSADEVPDRPHLQTFKQAVSRDPIALGRNIIRTFRSSGQCHDSFIEAIRDGNAKGYFKIKELQLLRDVKTRWDSVYLMLLRLRELQPVSYLI
jgi:hypothetical protein